MEPLLRPFHFIQQKPLFLEHEGPQKGRSAKQGSKTHTKMCISSMPEGPQKGRTFIIVAFLQNPICEHHKLRREGHYGLLSKLKRDSPLSAREAHTFARRLKSA